MFISAENAKIEFGEVCKRMQESLHNAINSLKQSSGENMMDVFKNLKSFLESANGTMKSIEVELRDIVTDCMNTQTELMKK